VSKKVIQTGVTTTTDYLSGFQYKNNVLQFFMHAEGYVNVSKSDLKEVSAAFNYVFNYTDHLGNIRLSYSQDPSTNVLKVIEENHYYPFGLKHTGYNSDKMMLVKEASILKIKPVPPLFKTSYDKKFNGKSWETDLSLNVYDFHARGYMPDIVRTFQQDPLAEKFSNMSPYSFLNNNPLYFVDPDGRDVITWLVNSLKTDGSMNATKGYASKAFTKGMNDFARTDYGKSYLLQFMKEGQSAYGVTATTNGKFSDQDLNLIDMNMAFALPSERGNTFITSDGTTTWEGKTVFPRSKENLDLNVYFNTYGESSIQLGETIAHELGLHGNNYSKYIKTIKEGKSVKGISYGESEHEALGNEDENNPSYLVYKSIMEQLEKIDIKYKAEREHEKEKYHE
jgi:RHS repeat-associated protein